MLNNTIMISLLSETTNNRVMFSIYPCVFAIKSYMTLNSFPLFFHLIRKKLSRSVKLIFTHVNLCEPSSIWFLIADKKPGWCWPGVTQWRRTTSKLWPGHYKVQPSRLNIFGFERSPRSLSVRPAHYALNLQNFKTKKNPIRSQSTSWAGLKQLQKAIR